MPEVLQGPPHTGGFRQNAAVDDDMGIGSDAGLADFLAPGFGVVEAAFLLAEGLPTLHIYPHGSRNVVLGVVGLRSGIENTQACLFQFLLEVFGLNQHGSRLLAFDLLEPNKIVLAQELLLTDFLESR